jgi:AraC-like DNA-binding protein
MRPTDPAPYQSLARSVGVMSKTYESGTSTGWHDHPRGQALYATKGLMLARTEAGAWAAPKGLALLIPPGLRHDISMHGEVRMLTAYVAPKAWPSETCRLILVSPLLDALLESMIAEPMDDDGTERSRALERLILDEIVRAPRARWDLPLPQSPNLRRLCEGLIADPARAAALDELAEAAAVSRRSFTRKFRDETGMSFGEWITRLRQMEAMRAVEEGEPPKRAAARAGYRSASALLAMMRRRARAESP